MTDAAPVRLAVVGIGHLGRQHARIAASLPGVRLVGLYDLLPERSAETARELGLETLPDLAAVADRCEAAVVATPTITHAEVAGFLLDRGRDVLVEKPIAASVGEAGDLIACARRRGRILQVGHVERYNPAVEAAFGLITQPRFVEAHRLASPTGRSLDVDVVRDIMIHDLQIAADLVRRPVIEIRAAGLPVLTPRLDIANARIAFEGGCVASLTASRVSLERVRKFRVFAPALYVSIDMVARKTAAYRLERHGDRSEVRPVPVSVGAEEPLARELSDFVSCVRGRDVPRVPGESGLEALVLADRVLEAIEAHRRTVDGEIS
jgi:predicted dehydrogenase